MVPDIENEALKLENEAFLQDFLEKQSLEAQKPSFSARLPLKLKSLELKKEAFLRDFLQTKALKLKNEASLETQN